MIIWGFDLFVWTAFFIFTIVLLISLDNLSGIGSIASLIFFFLVLKWRGLDILKLLKQISYWQIFIFLLAWFGLGFIWMFIRWWRFTIEEARLHKIEIADSHVRYYEHERPVLEKSKKRLAMWAAFWPWSMMAQIVNDPIRKFINWVIDRFSFMLEKITDHAYKGL